MDAITPLIHRGLLWAAAPGGAIPEGAITAHLPRQGSLSFETRNAASPASSDNVEHSENTIKKPGDPFQGYRLLDPESAFELAASASSIHEKHHRIVAPFRVSQIDEALPAHGLEFGALHEFIGGGNEDQRLHHQNREEKNRGEKSREESYRKLCDLPSYPLTVISHLAYNGWEATLPAHYKSHAPSHTQKQYGASGNSDTRKRANDSRPLQQSLSAYSEGDISDAHLSNMSTNSFAASGEKKNPAKLILWIGRSVWPTPSLLWEISRHNPEHQKLLFENMFFVNPRTPAEHLWALETALRSSQVAVVVSSLEQATGTTMRRLALAARRGNTLGILARTVRAYSTFLISQSRWSVQPYLSKQASSTSRQYSARHCWQMTLERCKGCVATPLSWVLEEHRQFHEAEALNKEQPYIETRADDIGESNRGKINSSEFSHKNRGDATHGDFEALSLRIPPELVNTTRPENARPASNGAGPFGSNRARPQPNYTRNTALATGRRFNIA